MKTWRGGLVAFIVVGAVVFILVSLLAYLVAMPLKPSSSGDDPAELTYGQQALLLGSQLEAAELQLGVYEGNERCLPLDVYISSNWGGGVLMVSQSELCGFNLHLSDKIWGPSTAAILQSKDEIIQELRGQIEALQLALEHERQQ